MRTNYLLIDFENVQPHQLVCLKGLPMRIKVFIGPTQTKIPVDIAVCLQSFGADAEYVRLDASGHNALDFHLAFYLGELVAGDAAGYFHIISRDTGFDPLVRHLQARKVSIQRYCDTIEIPFLKIAGAKTLPERIELILEKLCKQKTNRPSGRFPHFSTSRMLGFGP